MLESTVYSKMFSVTNVRGRLASGLASVIANTHHFHVTALGQMSHLRYGVPIGKRIFPFRGGILCSVLANYFHLTGFIGFQFVSTKKTNS